MMSGRRTLNTRILERKGWGLKNNHLVLFFFCCSPIAAGKDSIYLLTPTKSNSGEQLLSPVVIHVWCPTDLNRERPPTLAYQANKERPTAQYSKGIVNRFRCSLLIQCNF